MLRLYALKIVMVFFMAIFFRFARAIDNFRFSCPLPLFLSLTVMFIHSHTHAHTHSRTHTHSMSHTYSQLTNRKTERKRDRHNYSNRVSTTHFFPSFPKLFFSYLFIFYLSYFDLSLYRCSFASPNHHRNWNFHPHLDCCNRKPFLQHEGHQVIMEIFTNNMIPDSKFDFKRLSY